MALIDVNVEDGGIMLARILCEKEEGYLVQYLEETSRSGIYKFNKQKTLIPTEAVAGFYDTEDMAQAGYTECGDGRYTQDDPDYDPESEDDTDDEVSLCSENEEEEEA